MAKSKAPKEEMPAPAEENLDAPVDVVVEVEPEVSAKPKRSLATSVGKGVTLANFVISLLFVAVAVFFHSQKLEIRERKSQLEQTTRELNQLKTDRQAIVDGLDQELKAEELQLKTVGEDGQKELGTIEASMAQARQLIEAARKDQGNLSDESDGLQKNQIALIQEIQELRETLETTLGEKEAFVDERTYLEDQLAKTTNDLQEATRRQKEIVSGVAKSTASAR
ncbi:hypothetical protein K2X85_05695 [bacterium]|jgi:DNA repair exonuclease SbcCD ATPase subunit|nr:hypothetical protein [bacterium]